MALLASNPLVSAPDDTPSVHRVLESCVAHDHLCLIYETREEQFAAVAPFFRAGLERGEKCLYVTDENTPETVKAALCKDGIDVDNAIASGALAIVTKWDAYLKNGAFDPDWMIAFLKDAVESAEADGYTAFRVTGEATCALDSDSDAFERLIEYESNLNGFFPDHNLLAICQYNRNRFRPETLLQAIHTHPLLICGDLVCDNPHYIPPQVFKNKKHDTAAEVERLLNSVVQNARLKQRLAAEAEALRRSEQHFRAMIDTTPECVKLVSSNGTLLHMNPPGLAMVGAESAESVIGKSVYDLIAPEHRDSFRAFNQRICGGERGLLRFDIVGLHGIRRNMESHAAPFKAASGEILNLALTRDITEREQAEEALSRSEKRYRELLEALPVAVYTTDTEGRITLFNEAAAAFAGRQAEIGKDQWCVTHRLYRPDGSFLPHDECPMAVTLRTGEPQRGVEAIAEKPDGTRAWFMPHPTVVRDPSGEIAGGINVLVDITERKLAEDRQRQAEAALRKSEKFAAAGRMAATIAHEINNPLEAMMNLWFLLGQEKLSPDGQVQLKMLGDELSRVSHITKQTLEFYREGKMAAPFDLAAPINAAVNLFAKKAELHGTKIEVHYRTSATLFGFSAELRQVFANLIGNSLEAGATSIKIRMSPARDSGNNKRRGVRVLFADNGSGVSADSVRKLFEPFFTTKDEKGTGLGLWVSKGIVQKHEGRIRLRTSTKAGLHGTTFGLFLPTV